MSASESKNSMFIFLNAVYLKWMFSRYICISLHIRQNITRTKSILEIKVRATHLTTTFVFLTQYSRQTLNLKLSEKYHAVPASFFVRRHHRPLISRCWLLRIMNVMKIINNTDQFVRSFWIYFAYILIPSIFLSISQNMQYQKTKVPGSSTK